MFSYRGRLCRVNFRVRLPLLLFHLLTAVNAVKYDDLRPLIAVGITSSVLLAQHFGCSKRWINQLKREASPAGAPALAHLLLPRPGDAQLFQWVQDEVHRLGHAYGTKMIVGALMASHPGYHFGREWMRRWHSSSRPRAQRAPTSRKDGYCVATTTPPISCTRATWTSPASCRSTRCTWRP